MRLQDAGADHGEAVQPDLRYEHDQQGRQRRRTARTGGFGEDARRTAGHRASASRAGTVSTSKVQVSSADAVAAEESPPTGTDVPGNDRHDHPGEHAAGDDLEQHVGQHVRRVVRVPETGVADRLGEHQRSAEADEPGAQGQTGDTDRNAADATHAAGDRSRAGSAGMIVWLRRRFRFGLGRGSTAQSVEPAQPGSVRDHLGETHPLADRGQGHHAGQREHPRRPRQRRGGHRAQTGAQRVRAGSRRASSARRGRSAAIRPQHRAPARSLVRPTRRRAAARPWPPAPGAGRTG